MIFFLISWFPCFSIVQVDSFAMSGSFVEKSGSLLIPHSVVQMLPSGQFLGDIMDIENRMKTERVGAALLKRFG